MIVSTKCYFMMMNVMKLYFFEFILLLIFEQL